MPHETWAKLPDKERSAYRQLALDADILPDHYANSRKFNRDYCKCGESHPCSIRKFLTLPDLFKRGDK